MRLHLKLKHQAVLLIAIPLLFELIFVAILVAAMHRLEGEYATEFHARDVMMSVNLQLLSVVQAATELGFYQLSNDKRYEVRLGDSIKRMDIEHEHMRELMKVGEMSPAIHQFDTLSNQIVSLMNQIPPMIATGDRIDMMRSLVRMQRMVKEINETGRTLVEEQLQQSRIKEQREDLLRAAIQTTVFGGVAMNILLACFLVYYFNRSTSRRLDRVMQNMLSLAMEKPLPPTLSGTDEIASIDSTFHEMADLLAAARHKEQALAENAADIICSIDERGKFTKMNPACEKLLGYQVDELIGRSIVTLIAQNADDNRAKMDAIIAQKTSGSLEMHMRRGDGTSIEMQWSMQWSDAEKSLFCVAHDITERKRLERLKREVVAMVSHDLRSPLLALGITLEMFEEGLLGELNERGAQKINQGKNSIDRLVSIINDLLDIEKVGSGAFILNYGETSAGALLERSREAVQNSAEIRKIDLQVRRCDANLNCDGERVLRVLINLLDNALKFSRAGNKVELAAEANDGMVRFSVTDECGGIPPEKLELIFEPFKQSGRGDAGEKMGTGLGLAICKAIVEAHKGKIGVDSTIGQGSIFWFTLPALAADAEQATQPADRSMV